MSSVAADDPKKYFRVIRYPPGCCFFELLDADA